MGGAAHSLDGGFEDQPQSGPVHSGDFQETVHHGDNAVHERQAPECRLGEVWAVTARYQKKLTGRCSSREDCEELDRKPKLGADLGDGAVREVERPAALVQHV